MSASEEPDDWERRKDLLLYGIYIEKDGKRVDPLTVKIETVERARHLVGKSLVEQVREQQKVKPQYR